VLGVTWFGITGVPLDPPPLPDPGEPLVPEVLPDPAPEGGNEHAGATDDVLTPILYGNPLACLLNMLKPG
jgi:hypothetical protein